MSVITFICASVWPYFSLIGGPWVQFVSITAFLTTLVLFILYLFGIIYKIPAVIPWVLIVSITMISRLQRVVAEITIFTRIIDAVLTNRIRNLLKFSI